MGYKKQARFTPEFKAAAVRAAEDGKRTLTEIARDLGISRQLLHLWCKAAGVKAEEPSDEEILDDKDAEIRRLRAKIDQSQEERDILKKAAAFFAKESR